MGIQFRIVLIFAACLVVVAGILGRALHASFAENYAVMERREATINVARMVQSFESEFEHLANFVRDYGHWTATYDFARGRNPGWHTENGLDALNSSKTSVIAVIGLRGEFRHFVVQAADAQRITEAEAGHYAKSVIAADKPADCGLLRAAGGLMLSCWTQIRRSDVSGEPVGRLMMGRWLDHDFVARVRRQTQLDIALQPAAAGSPSPLSWSGHLTSAVLGGGEFTAETAAERLSIGYPLRDLRGEPVGALTMALPREIAALAEADFAKVRNQFWWTLLFTGLLLACAVHWLVVRRLRRMQRQLVAISDTCAWELRTDLSGDDELGSLARSANGLLETIQRQVFELDHANAVLGHMVALKTEQLAEVDQSLAQVRVEYEKAYPLATMAAVVPAVAHDLNTPVGNIGIAASTIRGKLEEFRALRLQGSLRQADLDALLGSVGEGMRIIETANTRVADLVHSLKQMSVDQATHRRRRFELGELVAEVVTTLSPALRKRGVQVAVEVPAGLQMDSYPGPLGQVLTNLLQNALVHAFAGREAGTVRISAARAASASIALKVEDDGVGMSGEVLARIFEPFFTTKAGQGGSGIGMTFSKRLVEESLGGKIVAESSPGAGTRFSLHLPEVAPIA